MSDAANIPYAQREPDDWTGSPLDVDGALDELASRTTDAETAIDARIKYADIKGNGIIARSNTTEFQNRTITAGTGITVTDGDGVSANPQIAVSAANSIDVSKGSVELVNDSGAPGNNKVYGTNGSGTRGWQSQPGQIIVYRFASSASSSGNYYLRSEGIQQMTSGVTAYGQQFVPRDASLVRVAISTEVTSYTSGTADIDIYSLSSPYSSESLVRSQPCTGPSGTGDYRETFDYAPGTYSFSEDDCIIVKVDLNSSGVMTVDDTLVEIWIQLDELWVPA